MIQVRETTKLTLWERMYIFEVIRGIGITTKLLIKNLSNYVANYKNPEKRIITTIQYPEETVEYFKGFRGVHRLVQREDGSPKCVACYMCATACPAKCITIEATEHDDPTIEKVPSKFEINELRCVVCGFCVEACPKDAIRMDTGEHHKPAKTREEFIYNMETLLNKKEKKDHNWPEY